MAFDLSKSLKEGLDLWLAGGWAMIPLALNALILFGKAAELRLALLRKGFQSRQWSARGLSRAGERSREGQEAAIARDYLASRGIPVEDDAGIDAMQAAFDELRAAELAPLNRDLKFIKIAMSAAPLWGLLGTVTGMLTTFDGLARGGGGDKTMDMVAGGISEALITTQTGLMIALPGLFFFHYLSRRRDAFEAFLTRLESSFSRHCLMHSEIDEAAMAQGRSEASREAMEPAFALEDAVAAT